VQRQYGRRPGTKWRRRAHKCKLRRCKRSWPPQRGRRRGGRDRASPPFRATSRTRSPVPMPAWKKIAEAAFPAHDQGAGFRSAGRQGRRHGGAGAACEGEARVGAARSAAAAAGRRAQQGGGAPTRRDAGTIRHTREPPGAALAQAAVGGAYGGATSDGSPHRPRRPRSPTCWLRWLDNAEAAAAAAAAATSIKLGKMVSNQAFVNGGTGISVRKAHFTS
jgi:hypothetical protein